MRFMTIYTAPRDRVDTDAPPSEDEITRMGRFIAQLEAEGVLVTTDGLMPSDTGARVRRAGDKITVTDGPFTEAKELVAGYAIVDVASREEAIELAKRFLEVAGDGESEVRQMHAAPAGGAGL